MGLFDFFKKKPAADIDTTESVCPNCWGKQEYGGKFIETAIDRQIDINNGNSSATRAFIQEFVTTHVDGIKLQKHGDNFVCPACKAGYKTVKPKV